MSNFKRTFGNATSPLALSYLDDNFSQLEAAGTSTVTLSGAQLIGYMQSGSGTNVSRNVQDWARDRIVSVKDKGTFNADGVTSDSTAMTAAISAITTDGKTAYIPDGTYALAERVVIPTGARVVWGPNAWFKCTAYHWGHLIGSGTVSGSAYSNIRLYGPKIDCDNEPGMNGIGFTAGQDINIYNPEVKNVLWDSTLLGGKAFAWEGETSLPVKDIFVWNPRITNASIGYSAQGIAGEEVINLNYMDGVMDDVDVPCLFLSQTGTGATDHDDIYINVHGLFGHNCGVASWAGATGTDAGVFCSDRAFGVGISDARIYNDAGYGTVGALFRGTFKRAQVKNVTFIGTLDHAVFNASPPLNFGSFSAAVIPASYSAKVIRVFGAADYLLDGHAAAGSGSLADTFIDDVEITTLNTGIVGTTSVTRTDIWVGNLRTPTSKAANVSGYAREIADSGNTIASYTREGEGWSETFRTRKSVANNSATGLFDIPVGNNDSIFVEYMVASMNAGSTNGAVAGARGLLGGTQSGDGNQTVDNGSAPNTVTVDDSLTPTIAVALATGSGKFTINVTQTNSAAAALNVVAEIRVYRLNQSSTARGKRPQVTVL